MIGICLLAAATVLTPPPALKVEGVPPIPAELAEDLARYGEFRTASFADWHPVRREMLILTRFADTQQVHRVAFPGGARSQLTFFPDRVSSARYAPNSGESFLFSKDTGGGEWYQLHLFDTRTGRTTMITDGDSRNTGPRWSPGGRYIAWTSSRRGTAATEVRLGEAGKPRESRVLMTAPTGGWAVAGWAPDETWLIVQRRTSAYESALFRLDVETGRTTPLTPETPGVLYTDPSIAPDGRGAWLITNRDSDFNRLAYMDFASGKLTFPRSGLTWDVSAIELSRDGRRLAWESNENGVSVLRVLDTASGADVKLPPVPAGVMGSMRWHPNGRDLAFSLSSARSPSDVYSIDVESGKLERWTFSETGGVDPSTFVEPEVIQWKSFDGRTISGLYYAPPKRFTGPRPVIINIHGGPEGQSRPGYLGRNNYYLNELGVALIYPNVRGSAGYGKTFLNLDNAEKREDSVRDIGALLDWIASRPGLDAKRVMVTGGSYGGYMTLASMTLYNDRLCCGVDVVGISNWVTFLETTESYRRDLRRVEYGDERNPKMRDFLSTISPLSRASRVTRPMMIVQGRNDPRVPWTESEQFVKAVRNNGAPVWYLLAADEGHGFAKKGNQDYQFAATVQFVREHLLK